MIQETSLEAYESIVPELGKRRQQVYDVITNQEGLCNKEIAEILHLDINCITPRVNELRAEHLVMFHSYKKDEKTNRRVMTWKIC